MKLIDRILNRRNIAVQDNAMDIKTAKDFKKILYDNLKDFLIQFGYKKTNSAFTKNNEELTYFIQIQSSQSSTMKLAKLTVNLGIISKVLLSKTGQKTEFAEFHWRDRIGFFLEQPTDKWWFVESIDEAHEASREIIELIEKKVFKEWTELNTTEDLRKIWLTGKCTGISEKARKYYLNELEK